MRVCVKKKRKKNQKEEGKEIMMMKQLTFLRSFNAHVHGLCET